MPGRGLLDLSMDADGELAIDHTGDLLFERDSDVVATEIMVRLKTFPGDWVLEPDCGAGLESLIGEANTPELAAEMEGLIYQALTHDGYLAGELREVRVVRVNPQELLGLISVEYGDEHFTSPIRLSLREGIL